MNYEGQRKSVEKTQVTIDDNSFLRNFAKNDYVIRDKVVVERSEFEIEPIDAKKLLQICNESDLALFIVLFTCVKIVIERYTKQDKNIIVIPKYQCHDDLKKDDRYGYIMLQDIVDVQDSIKNNILMSRQTIMNAYENQNIDLIKQYSVEERKKILVEYPFCSLVNIHGDIEVKTCFHIKFQYKDCIKCQVFYDGSRFSGELVTSLICQLKHVVIECIYNYTKIVSDIDLMSEETCRKILDFSAGNQVILPDVRLHNLFEQQVKLTPQHPAIVFDAETISYAELNRKANFLATYLLESGVEKGSGIPLFISRGISMIVAILGVLKAGCYYIPLSKDEAPKRVNAILKNCATTDCIVDNEMQDINCRQHNIVSIFETNMVSSDYDENIVDKSISGEDLAYVIFTSGTSGIPKGVMIQHQNIVNSILWRKNEYLFDEADRVLQLFSYTFDGFMTAFFTPILSGATVVLVNEDEMFDTKQICEILRREKITHFIAVPALAEIIVETAEKEQLESINVITLAGDISNVGILETAWQKNPDIRFTNEYGPTETSVVATYCPEMNINNINCIGRPIDNTYIYILDENMKLLPEGIWGEVHIAGAGVAKGYLDNKLLSEKAFIKLPIYTDRSVYRTGDVARWLPDGTIEFRGRKDNQIKLRGFRIELDEIRAHLLAIEKVEDAYCFVHGKGTNRLLCAIVKIKNNLLEDEIKKKLEENLPSYMIPQRFIYMEEIPKNRNGKVDTTEIEKIISKASSECNEYRPQDDIERRLVNIWKKVLEVDKIDSRINFFELGGHSLRAMKLLSMIYSEFDVKLPLNQILKTPILEDLADVVRIKSGKDSYELITKSEISDKFPLSFEQLRMFFLHKNDSTGMAYNIPVCFIARGEIDFNKLRDSIDLLVKRHEILRTSFIWDGNDLVQVVDERSNWLFRVETAEDDNSANSKIRSSMQVFVLEQSSLFQVYIVTVPNGYHYILFDFHHIIMDGVSLKQFMYELSEIYNGNEVVEPKLQYRDYVFWQKNREGSQQIKRMKRYWMEKIQYCPMKPLNLPYDYSGTKKGTDEIINRIEYHPNPIVTSRVERLTKDFKVTKFVFYHTCLAILLNKYTNTDKITIGTSVMGRSHPDLANSIGVFINTIPIYLEIEQCQSFEELVKADHSNILNDLENGDFQFEQIVNLNQNYNQQKELFNVFLIVQELNVEKYNLGETTLQHHPISNNTSKFDLTFEINELDSELYFTLEYAADLFAKDTIISLLDEFGAIVEKVSANPTIKIDEIDVGVHNQMLYDIQEESPETIVSLFEEKVNLYPKKIAVEFEDCGISYKDLNAMAEKIAKIILKNVGRQKGIIAVYCERSIFMIASIIGILKSGNAYLPIDVAYPLDRVNFMLDDSDAKAIITNILLPDELDFWGGIITENDLRSESINTSIIMNEIDAKDIAYVIYTSGTTGLPKGCAIEHRNLVNLINNSQYHFNFSENDVWTMFHSVCFDFSVWEIFGALLSGGKVLVIPTQMSKDPEAFFKYIWRSGVTILNQTPTAFSSLANVALKCDVDMDRLRYVIFGGEALIPCQLREWRNRYSHIKLINMYGITETTVHVTYKELTDNELADTRSIIGKPLTGGYIYLLDSKMRKCPRGAIGEIYVGGNGVGRGYINREGLNERSFVEDPFISGKKLYKSGDLAKELSTGEFVYYGRVDRQVKLRGHRIELLEIESVLLGFPLVDECTVIFQHDTTEPYIAAYCVSNVKLSQSEIRNYMKKYLPEYMIPAYILQIDVIPRTINGKVDTKLLPEPHAVVDYEYVRQESLNDSQKKLCHIWTKVLGISLEKINPEVSFFAMGGDSIKAIKLLSAIEEMYGHKVSLSTLYENSTVKSLSAALELKTDETLVEHMNEAHEKIAYYKKHTITKMREKGMDTSNIEDIYPMSDIELGMIYHNLRDSKIYHDQILFQFKCMDEDINRLSQALTLVCEKHSILRTTFNLNDYIEPMHIVYRDYPVEYAHIDLRNTEKDYQIKFIRKYMEEDRLRGIENLNKPLWRAVTFYIDDDTVIFLLIAHHAILDGWSVAQFEIEFLGALRGLRSDSYFKLKSLKNTYKQYVLEQYILMQDDNIKIFWRDNLKEVVRLQIPLEQKHKEKVMRKKTISSCLDPNDVKCVSAIAEQYQTEIKTIYLAAYAYALNMLSYDNDFIIGVVSNNRPICEDGDLILGCFLNTVPFRIKIEKEWSYADLILNIVRNVEILKRYERLSLPAILNLLENKTEEFSLFDCTFNYVNFSVVGSNRNSLGIEDDVSTDTTLDFVVDATDEITTISITYDIKCDEVYVHNLLNYFERTIACFINRRNDIMHKIDLMSHVEIEQLMLDGQVTKRDYPLEKPVHVMFQEQAIQFPERIAVVYKKDKLTYGELNRKTNALATKIRQMGIGRNDCVVARIDISIDMVIAMLGVFKSGGVFLPIDRKTPKARLEYILENSNSKLLLTQSHLLEEGLTSIPIILLDSEIYDDIGNEEVENVNVDTDLAYIIYTSGTTGQPKGVMIEHRSLTNLCCWHIEEYGISSFDKATKYANYGFDVSIWEIMPYLMVAAEIHILPDDILLEMKCLDKYFISNDISMVYLPTPVCEEYMKEGKAKFRFLLTAGDKLRSYVPGNYVLANDYGPTEATIIATSMIVNKQYENIPIGKPISNMQTVIMDKNRNIQPKGIVGELGLAGVGLARGYYGNMELTEKMFFIMSEWNNERVYCTGDLARYLTDGNIEYLGRNDRQVKLRGHRIELEEIEHHLKTFKEVDRAVVVKDGMDGIAAFFVANTKVEPSILEDRLRVLIPEYMIPKRIIEIKEMPLTSNGKIDFEALEHILNSTWRESPNAGFATPSTNEEKLLHDIWCQILRVNEFGVDDNFFLLGGDSIKAMQVVGKLSSFGIYIQVNDMFKYKTIREMCKNIIFNQNVVEQKQIIGQCPLSPIQNAFFESKYEMYHHWNQSFLLHSPEKVDVFMLKQIVEKIVEHHDILRARIDEVSNVMTISKEYEMVEVLEDIVEDDDCECIPYIEQDANKMQSTLNVHNGPIMRTKIYKTAKGDYILLIIHHLFVDSVSWRIILEDLANLIEQYKSRMPMMLPRKTSSYYAYVNAIQKYVSENDLSKDIMYWKGLLYDTFDSIPAQKQAKKHLMTNFEKVEFEINEIQTTSLILKVCSILDVSMQSIILYSFGMALRLVTGGNKWQIMLESHGREEQKLKVNLSRTVGWFTEIYPFVLEIKTDDAWENLNSIMQALDKAAEYRFSYGVILYMANLSEKYELEERFCGDILFNYLGELDNVLGSESFSICDVDNGLTISKSAEMSEAMRITSYVLNKKLHCEIEYDKETYNDSIVQRISNCMHMILQGILSNYDNEIGREAKTMDAPMMKWRPKGFNEVFMGDCFTQSILHVVDGFKSNKNILFANLLSVYQDEETKDIYKIKNKSVHCKDIFSLLNIIGIHYHKKSNITRICEVIKENIIADKLVVINLDCYYLPEKKEMFMHSHWSHSVVVYGVDDINNKFKVIDNGDVFSLNYDEREISYDDLKRAYHGYIQHFAVNNDVGTIYIFDKVMDLIVTEEEVKRCAIDNYILYKGVIEESISCFTDYNRRFSKLLIQSDKVIDNAKELYFLFNEILTAKKIELYKDTHILKNIPLAKFMSEIIDCISFIVNLLRKEILKKNSIESSTSRINEKWDKALGLEIQYYKELYEWIESVCNAGEQ